TLLRCVVSRSALSLKGLKLDSTFVFVHTCPVHISISCRSMKKHRGMRMPPFHSRRISCSVRARACTARLQVLIEPVQRAIGEIDLVFWSIPSMSFVRVTQQGYSFS